MWYAPKQSLQCLLLLSIACSGSAHRVQQSVSGPESVFVSVANADCLKNETLGTPLEAQGAAVRIPVRATGKALRLPADLRLFDGLSVSETGIIVSVTRGAWYWIDNRLSVGTLGDNRSTAPTSCSNAGPAIRAAMRSAREKLGLVLAPVCKWRDRASGTALDEHACEGVRDFAADERVDIEFRNESGHYAALAIVSGTLGLHAVNYGSGQLVTCRRRIADSDALVASLVEYSRREPEWDYAEVEATGCVGWLVGETRSTDINGFELDRVLQEADPSPRPHPGSR